MHWITNFFGSSIGKKLLMAITGFCFIGFLTVHLAGNLTLYGGKDMFNAYAEHLHALGPILLIAEWGLIFLAAVHILTGSILFFQNLNARPNRYKMNKRAGGRTWGSITMPYTGFIILIFVIFHLLNFHFIDKTNTTIYEIVSAAFQSPIYMILYIAAMGVVALHIRHGFWSLIQTLGANHPKYMTIVMFASVVVSIIFGVGFGFLPVYMSVSG
jgi:succinate dehydrogenase / fumarate reductase cytochrome b subunit